MQFQYVYNNNKNHIEYDLSEQWDSYNWNLGYAIVAVIGSK